MRASGTEVFSVSLTDGRSTMVSNYDTSGFGNIFTAATQFSASSVPEPSSLVTGIAAALTLACVYGLRLLKGPRVRA